MIGNLNDRRNIVGLTHLMKDETANDINIEEIEKNIINEEREIQFEEDDVFKQYQSNMRALSSAYGINLNNPVDDPPPSTFKTYGDSFLTSEEPASTPMMEAPHKEEDDLGDINGFDAPTTPSAMEYKFQTPVSEFEIQDEHLRSMTQEQQKRKHLRQVYNSLNRNNTMAFDNCDLVADREYDDKQNLISTIEELRDDLKNIGIDISKVKEVDMNSSMTEIMEAYNKLKYKSNNNSYNTYADELILLAAQAAEYVFDGEKEYFGHKPDLTGWSNTTVKSKLRRMRHYKAQIVRDIVDDYQIPVWLQMCLEIIPSALTYSRNRKGAVRDNIVNSNTYKNAIHDLNNMS